MPIQRAVWFGGFLVALLLLAGCDRDNTVEVKGTVQFDGKPIEDGSINFVPADGKSQTAGGAIKDGKYSVKVPVGPMKLTISAPKVVGKKKLYDTPESPERPVMAESLPAKYADREKTELEFEVKPGVNEKNWDLKK
jgi:hypothetical protein